MKLEKMNSENIYYGFVSGAHEVIKQRKELNRINVFPVADGDTGSNLAYTMNTIIQNANIESSARETMGSIAEAALIGARGNSGIIFAQFINGIYMEMEEVEDFSVKSFSRSVSKAVEYAYKAIAEPVEGTMITVMKDWADSLDSHRENVADFNELFTSSLEVALKSLMDTPKKLKVLRDAKVVDSGAKGFVHFVEGFLNFIMTGKIEADLESSDELKLSDEHVHFEGDFDLENRYCTEALIEGENLDIDYIREKLKEFGVSLISAGNKKKMRIHIHTENPDELFFKLKEYGKITYQKVDDMKRQYESMYSRNSDIALVTDSIADLPKELMDKYQIHLVPLNLLIEDTNYLDKVTITPSYFYKLMDQLEEYPSSSQPTVLEVEKALNELSEHYKSIVVVTVSKQMSGTYNSFIQAVEKLAKKDINIEVIDSKLNSGAQGLVVLRAAEEIAKGKSFNEVVKITRETVENTDIFVSVPTLKYMLKSGRVGKAKAMAASILNLKPVVSIDEDGNGIVIGNAFSTNGNTKKIKELVDEIMKDKTISRYSLVHANASDRLEEYKKYYEELLGKEAEYIMEISPIVAMNAGIGCVAISVTAFIATI